MAEENQAGTVGVKAILNRIHEQYKDSHVQLPDGTVPKGKVAMSRTTKESTIACSSTTAASAFSNTPFNTAQGVKAKLAEINSKYANSFVMLPDGTVPNAAMRAKNISVPTNKTNPDSGQSNDTSDKKSSMASSCENDEIKNSVIQQPSQDNLVFSAVVSDYEPLDVLADAHQNRTSSLEHDSEQTVRSPILGSPISLITESALPAPLERKNAYENQGLSAALSVIPKVESGTTKSKIDVHDELPPDQFRSPSLKTLYGIGINFKTDHQGFLEVRRFIIKFFDL
jgi:hypothetical protein